MSLILQFWLVGIWLRDVSQCCLISLDGLGLVISHGCNQDISD